MYEAAMIDGATKWEQTKYITIPSLRPIISIMFILAVGSIFRSDFGLFYQATRNSGSLTDITMTIDVYVYKALLERPNINLSSAASLLQSILGCITIVAANLIVKKIDPDAGLF
jgi:putative aldouronate transport system permease protein